jgi:Raf kinase inhibitor-like YbhB/YbcL family protein
MRTTILPLLVLTAVPAVALAERPAQSRSAPAPLYVNSPAFGDNQRIPTQFTCEGVDVSPPLTWSAPPPGTRSIAILVEDRSGVGGKFTHWLVTGLPPWMTSIDKGAVLPEGAIAARNDKGHAGYAGPCPPTGLHRYHFLVYALDVWLSEPMTRSELLTAIRGHVLARGELVGVYEKQADRY